MMAQPSGLDYYSMSAFTHPRKQDVLSLSPVSLYSLQADFSTDSAPSPGSPASPVFTNPYQLPTTDDWVSWDDDKPIDFTNPANNDAYEPDLSGGTLRAFSASPAVNPMELSNPIIADDVTFCPEGLNDTQPLFQSPATSIPAATTADLVPARAQAMYAPPPAIKTSPPASPRLSDIPSRYPNRKRKSSSSTSPSSPSARSSASPPPAPATRRPSGPAPKKTAHNMIEKRYRTNLNDKIAALRDSVPALRVMVHRIEGGANNHPGSSEEADGEDVAMAMQDDEDLGGLAPAHKLNKATILSKATEYISHLERKNRNLAKENAALRSRVEGFEMLVMSRGGNQGVWN